MITAKEMKAGQAAVTPTMAMCAACAAEVKPGAPPHQPRPATPLPARSPRRHTPPPSGVGDRLPAGAEGGGGSPRVLLALLAAIGIALTIIALALLLKGPSGSRRPSSPPATAPQPAATPGVTAPVAPARPAQPPRPAPTATRRPQAYLAEIRAMIDPSLRRYKEIRRALKAVMSRHAGTPVAEEARKIMAQVDAEHAALADRAFWSASESAYALVARGTYREASSALNAVKAQYGGSAWAQQRGDARIDALLAHIGTRRVEAAEESIAEARDRLEENGFATARKLLSPRDRWPEEQKARATELLAKIDEREAAHEVAAARDVAWGRFVVSLAREGAKGVEGAVAFAARQRPKLRELKIDDRLAKIERRLRDARAVQALIEDGLRNARGFVRLRHGDRRVAGRVVSIAEGVVTLDPKVGENVEVPMSEVAVEDLVHASGLLRFMGVSPLRVASYYLVRGEIDMARRTSADLIGHEAEALAADIGAYADALAAQAARDR
jgi:hypothetical protein